MIYKCQDLIGAGGFDMHALQLATSVAVGKASEDKVAMGVLEGTMMKLENPSKATSFRGRLRNCDEFCKERLRLVAIATASSRCSCRLKNMMGVMKSPAVLQNKNGANSVLLRSFGRRASDA